MERLDRFDQFVLVKKNLKECNNIKFSLDVLASLESEPTILFFSSYISSEKLYEFYYDKYNIQKMLKVHNVLGYESLLDDLGEFNKSNMNIGTVEVYTNEAVYIILIDLNFKIVSIIKSLNSSILKIIGLIKNYKEYSNTDYLFLINSLEIRKEEFIGNVDSLGIIPDRTDL